MFLFICSLDYLSITSSAPIIQAKYEGHLKSSWTDIILSRNFVEVRLWSPFRSPLASDALLTTLHPFIENVLQTADHFEISCLGAPFSWFETGLYGGRSNGIPLIHFFQAEHRIKFRSRPMWFLGFSNHEKEAARQKVPKGSTVYSTFLRSGWSVVWRASLANGDTSRKRPSPHLHEVPTRSNKVSPPTLQTTLVKGDSA
jgi:hypothetical protein